MGRPGRTRRSSRTGNGRATRRPGACRRSAADIGTCAGVPLYFEGERVGVLCIGDSKPRDLDAAGISLLRDLGAMAEEKFEIAEAERSRAAARIAVMLIDIDHFKSINDAYGHAAADEVLRASAERLRASMRPMDAVGRFGGEEFVVLMSDVHAAELPGVAERVRSSQAKTPVHFENHAIGWTCSLGYALGTADEPISTLLRRADQALYRAKAGGRNRVEAELVEARPD